MEKRLEEYLHLYIGQECLCKYPFAADSEIRKKVHPVNLHELLHEVEYCKLLLRPLFAMTTMEAMEFFSLPNGSVILEIREDSDWDVAVTYSYPCKEGFHGNVYLTKNRRYHSMVDTQMNKEKTPREFLWFLSHGFDIFGLIEDGLAIDKTK